MLGLPFFPSSAIQAFKAVKTERTHPVRKGIFPMWFYVIFMLFKMLFYNFKLLKYFFLNLFPKSFLYNNYNNYYYNNYILSFQFDHKKRSFYYLIPLNLVVLSGYNRKQTWKGMFWKHWIPPYTHTTRKTMFLGGFFLTSRFDGAYWGFKGPMCFLTAN